jgi:hypothetical protein
MVVAEASGKPVGLAETPVGNVFKEHVVDVPLRPVGDDTAEGAARFFAGFLHLEKVNVFV